jgi:tRNA threonylcarbamoyladenosine biosynthesis protein TsaB
MLLLALDTSTHQSSIALCSNEQFYAEQSWYSRNNHSVELLSNIQRLLADAGITMAQLDAIAVATGPGAFNGVRVALATAKSLAFALRKPLVGIPTLDCIALRQQLWSGPICALLEAGRSELYAACYQLTTQSNADGVLTIQLQRFGEYQMLSPESLVVYLQEQSDSWLGVPGERLQASWLFCGEISASSREALRAQLQERCLFTGPEQAVRYASYLAVLARQRLEAGQEDDPLLLEPLYLRRPSITTSKRKQPLLGGLSM